MTQLPTVSLAIDNCFASKRWTRPREWMELVRQFGLRYVEASADTEADPLYCGEDYIEDWIDEVSRCEKAYGVKVANLYSGHGTYSTLGLGHTDDRVRRRMLDLWVKPMIRAAARLGAGLGFYCHAFPDAVLQDPTLYAEALHRIQSQLSQVAVFGAEQGAHALAVEQMYSPHQVPWTIDGARQLMRQILSEGHCPLYLTIDTGHQTGQHAFTRPAVPMIRERVARVGGQKRAKTIWLGSVMAQERFERCVSEGGMISDEDLAFIETEMDRHPYLFSASEDADTYSWLESLGRFSPIVHLQQVIGGSSSHLPFTAETNAKGSIRPDRVLHSLLTSYQEAQPIEMPSPPKEIFLTLEIFSGTAQTSRDILSSIRETVDYWRRFIPKDGLRLDCLV